MVLALRRLWPLWLLAFAGCYELHRDALQVSAPPADAASPVAPPVVAPPVVAPPRVAPPAVAPAPTDAGGLDGGAHSAGPDAATAPVLTAPEPNLRVAFLGDQGLGEPARAVLKLIADEGADLVVHAGDLDYVDDVEGWDAQVDAVLGPSFPYFVAIGNHEVPAWSTSGGYRDVLLGRLARIDGARCDGDYGVNALCRYRGLAFVLSGVGTYGEDHEAFLDTALAERTEVWRLCVWHKNQHDMQVGAKTDEVGWGAYRTCAAHGAPIVTAHEHSYSRTFTLLRIGSRETEHGAAFGPWEIALEPGRTMVVVTGLGGLSARAITDDHAQDTWWASIYARGLQLHNGIVTGTATEIEAGGALFVDFHVDGDPHRARGYFKTISGAVVDDFGMTTR